MLSLESSSSRMSNLARQEMYFTRQTSMDEVLARIEKVTAEDLQQIARQLFERGKCAMAALGQTNGLRIEQNDLVF